MKNQVKIEELIKPFKQKINIPSDKSLSIRCILLASIAAGKSSIYNILESEDVENSLKAVKKIGVNYKKKKNCLQIFGVGINGFSLKKNTTIYSGNSGTLARCIVGLCSGINKKIKLTGDHSLSKRDFSRVVKPLNLFGVKIKTKKGLMPLELNGTNLLKPISYFENKGSAQVKTCIILSAINTPGITKLKAKKSRNHTELLCKYLKLPINIKKNKNFDLIEIQKVSKIKPINYNIPSDISSSAFFIVLTLLSKKSSLIIKNVNINPSRTGFISILNKMGAKITFKNKKIYNGEKIADIFVKSVNKLKAIKCPTKYNSSAIDEFLIIFIVAAKAKGISYFRNLSELNQKESPRLKIASEILNMIGIKVFSNKNSIKIYGNPNLELNKNYIIKNFLKDHRVFMMSVISALSLGGTWKIYNPESVKTSFPSFLKIISKLGAKIN